MPENIRAVVGRLGGLVKNPNKGFGTNTDLSKVAGKKGGMMSRRGVAFSTHQHNLDNLFKTWHIKDWADIFWSFEPEIETGDDGEGHQEMYVRNYSQLVDTVVENLTEIYVEDYAEEFVEISEKLAQRIEDYIRSFVEEIEGNIYDQLIEDQRDYTDTIDSWRQDYYDLVHPE